MEDSLVVGGRGLIKDGGKKRIVCVGGRECVTISVLILGMPSLRSTRSSDLQDRQFSDAGTRSSTQRQEQFDGFPDLWSQVVFSLYDPPSSYLEKPQRF